jgi:hypothetical protein
MVNLALALLLSDRPAEADKALSMNPNDEVTQRLLPIVGDVLQGKLTCAHHVHHLRERGHSGLWME